MPRRAKDALDPGNGVSALLSCGASRLTHVSVRPFAEWFRSRLARVAAGLGLLNLLYFAHLRHLKDPRDEVERLLDQVGLAPLRPQPPQAEHRHRLPDGHVVRRRGVLGGLHHEYWLDRAEHNGGWPRVGNQSSWDQLKNEPKQATTQHTRDFLEHLEWLR